MVDENTLDLLVELEKSLHSDFTRKSKEKLSFLLHDSFIEIGSSGNIYNKKQTINNLTKEKSYKIKSTGFKLHEISEDVFQLIYITKINLNHKTTQNALRSSLWKNTNNEWQMISHQGTILTDK